jgi:hypothetical protein
VTRVLPVTDAVQLEVTIHQDETVVHVKENGKFLTHYMANGNVLRSFTCDTVPFAVQDARDKELPRISLQEVLAKAYQVLNHPFDPSPGY